jgi:hypothetical protein
LSGISLTGGGKLPPFFKERKCPNFLYYQEH